MDNLEGVLSSLACMNGSFLTDQDRHYDCSGYNHGVDTELALRAMKCLEDTKNSSLKEMIRKCFHFAQSLVILGYQIIYLPLVQ